MLLKEVIPCFKRNGLKVLSHRGYASGHEHNDMSIIFSHGSYPNCEAHLFTLADAAGWQPRLLCSGDLEIRCAPIPEQASFMVDCLMEMTQRLMRFLEPFKRRVAQGEIPYFIWAHHEFRWHRFVWESSSYAPSNISEFIEYVDSSIRSHIRKLNELGFATKESCSGLLTEHLDREPYWPYIMFDERAYTGISPHLFTLADISSWNVGYAPHNFDIYMTVPNGAGILDSFDRITSNAIELRSLLEGHFRSVAMSNTSHTMWRHQSFPVEG